MITVLLAALLAAASPADTVHTVDGGRVVGTVLEESPSSGVTVQAPDGAVRRIAAGQVARIEYSDGTVSEARPLAPRPAAAPVAAVAPPAQLTAGPPDTVFFAAGGRVRGTVIEENQATGVRIRRLDGSLHTYSVEEVARVEYSDGTVSRRKPPPPPPPPPLPAGVPPPPPPPAQPTTQLAPIYLTLGAGVTWFGGEVQRNLPMTQLFKTQGHLSSELGLRLGPSWAIGVYGDVGGGDVAALNLAQCQMQAQMQSMGCMGMTSRIGFLLRHTWGPRSPMSKWLSLGTGWEQASVLNDNADHGSELFTYSGREIVRVGAGFDFRSGEVLGIGLYASFAWGEYDQYKDSSGTRPIDKLTHTTGQVGLRLTLFP